MKRNRFTAEYYTGTLSVDYEGLYNFVMKDRETYS